MKTLWKTVCTAVCLCAVLCFAVSCAPTVGGSNGGSSGGFIDEPYADFSTVHVQVTDSIGGTFVSGTTLKVYKSGTTEQIGTYTVTDGKVKLENLATEARYDFELIGIQGEWAGSRLENYKLPPRAEQTLSLIQPVHGMITRGITPPKIDSIKKAKNLSDTFTDLSENSFVNAPVYIKVVFSSDVGAVKETDGGGFGAKLGIGKSPNVFTGIDGSIKVEKENDSFISTGIFRIKTLFKGNDDLVITGYDVANNRMERHMPLKFENNNSTLDLSSCSFRNLSAFAERLPYSEGILSLQPVGGRRSSYKMTVIFEFVNSYGTDKEILGFDLYRRKKGLARKFRFVSRTLYNDLETETSGLGFHAGFDTDSQLEENTEYEYKIRAFNEKYEKFSPVITVKLLESFTYELTEPVNNAYMPLADTANLAYKCKISNANMFSPAQSDYISLGLLINKFDGNPVFGARFFYLLNGSGSPDMLIFLCDAVSGNLQDPEWVSDLIAAGKLSAYGITSVNDLVKVDKTTGIVEFTKKFVQVPFFNVIPIGSDKGLNRAMNYETGVAYQWDIQDWGLNPYDLYDDEALSFVKNYPYTSAGSTTYCKSISRGNNSMNGANAINGRFTFTVTP